MLALPWKSKSVLNMFKHGLTRWSYFGSQWTIPFDDAVAGRHRPLQVIPKVHTSLQRQLWICDLGDSLRTLGDYTNERMCLRNVQQITRRGFNHMFVCCFYTLSKTTRLRTDDPRSNNPVTTLHSFSSLEYSRLGRKAVFTSETCTMQSTRRRKPRRETRWRGGGCPCLGWILTQVVL